MKKNLFLQNGIAVLLGLSIGTNAHSAEFIARLTQIEGSVLVNQGKNYDSAQTGMQLKRDDRVLVRADGSARVVYQNGCVLRLGPNSLLILEGEDQCTKGAVVYQAGGTSQPAGTTGTAGSTSLGAPETAATESTIAGIPATTAVIAAGVIAIGAGVAAAASGGGGGGPQVPISGE